MRKGEDAGWWKRVGGGGKQAADAGKIAENAGRSGGSAEKSAGVMTAAWIAVAAAVFLTGCSAGGNSFPTDRSVIYIAKDGGLYTVLCGEYDAAKDYYSEDELTARVEEEVAVYNAGRFADEGQENGRLTDAENEAAQQLRGRQAGTEQRDEAVTVERVRLGDGTASIVLRYSDAENLMHFTEASQDADNHTEKLSVTMVGEGLPDVPDEDEAWTDAKRNDPVTPEQIRRRTDLHLVTVSGPVTVQTEKRILYYSGAVSLLDKHTAQVADGDAYIVYK